MQISKHNVNRRKNPELRKLVVIGNLLTMWAGREPKTQPEREGLEDLFNAWETALKNIRDAKDF